MQPHSVKEFIQLFAKMHLEDPDIFSMFKIEFNQEVEKYRGPDAGRQYIQFVSFKGRLFVVVTQNFLGLNPNLVLRPNRTNVRLFGVHISRSFYPSF